MKLKKKIIMLAASALCLVGITGCLNPFSPSYPEQAKAVADTGTTTDSGVTIEESGIRNGGIYFNTFFDALAGTGVEIDDIVIKDRNGTTLFEDNFENGNEKNWTGLDWGVVDGADRKWSISGGTLNRKQTTAFFETTNLGNWAASTITCKVKKVAGAEGIAIAFAATAYNNGYQFNIGGWNNTRTVLQRLGTEVTDKVGGSDGIIGETTNADYKSMTDGVWYNVKIEMIAKHIKCYMDNVLLMDVEVQ